MKKFKTVIILVSAVAAVLYGIFLFVLPNVLNLNNYKKDLQRLAFENANLDVRIEDIKLVTTPALHVGVRVKGLDVLYTNGNELISADEAVAGVKLVPLLFRTIELSDVKLSEPSFSVRMLKDNQLDLVKFVNKTFQPENSSTVPIPFNFSKKLPKVVISNYKIIAEDLNSENTIVLKGDSFLLDKAVVEKQFHLNTVGKIFVNDDENITFKINADSFWPIIAVQNKDAKEITIQNVNFIKEFAKLNLKASIDSDVKIRTNKEELQIDGYANVDKMSLVLDSHKMPESFIHLLFKGSEIKLDSDLYISEIEKAEIKADIINSKKFLLDLNLKTDKISFLSIQKFLSGFFNAFNLKNDFNQFSVSGFLQSDFSLRTDLKKFKSDGFFKINNGQIQHKKQPVKITAISSDIDFSKNNVNIKNAGANINGAKIKIEGNINSKSVADITVVSDSLPLESIYAVAAPFDMKRAYDLKNGNLTLNAQIKGKLSEIAPKISVNLTNLKIKDNINGFILSNRQSVLNVVAKENSFNGDINVTGAKLQLIEPVFNVDIPAAEIKINPDDIAIVPFNIMIEASPLKVTGGIKNYIKKPEINILANGFLNAADLLKIIPSESRNMISAKGKIPVRIEVSGDCNSVAVNAQAKSDAANYFSPVIIKKMLNKSGLVNLSLSITGNRVMLDNLGLYIMSRGYSDDFKKNLNNAEKLAEIYGEISDIGSGTIRKIEIAVPEPLTVGTALLPRSSFKTRGRMTILGNFSAPRMNGFFEVKEADIAEFLTKIDLINVNFNDEIINADIQNLNINGSPLNIKADALPEFGKIFVINTVEIISPLIDADKIMSALAAESSGAAQPAANTGSLLFPVRIVKGHGVIDKFKSGNISAQNASGNFTLNNDTIQIPDLKASAFDGNFGGKVSYNLKTTKITADVYGKSMDANKAVTALVSLKDQVKGNLDFDADISLSGVNYKEQMKTLKGNANFTVKDGQLGSLGRLETFLQADNLLSQSFLKTETGSLVSAVAPYNTGKFSYLNGKFTFANGTANIDSVKSSGPHMSLMISGPYNLLTNAARIQILGSLSETVWNALGPVANLSVDKIAAYIPKFGSTVSAILGTYNAQANEGLLSSIPKLTPEQENTKSFKVVLDGNMMNPPKAIKSFQWLNTAEQMESSQKSILDILKPTSSGIPHPSVSKQDIKEDLKNQLEAKPQVQKIKENKAVKTFSALYNLYKQKDNSAEK